jgi:hypothetical protein
LRSALRKSILTILFYVFSCSKEGPPLTPEHSPKRRFARNFPEGCPDQFPIRELVEERRIAQNNLKNIEVQIDLLLEILKDLGHPIETLGITTTRTLQPLNANRSSEGRDFRKEWDNAQAAIKQAEDEECRIRQAIEEIIKKRNQLSQKRVEMYQEAFVASQESIAGIFKSVTEK